MFAMHLSARIGDDCARSSILPAGYIPCWRREQCRCEADHGGNGGNGCERPSPLAVRQCHCGLEDDISSVLTMRLVAATSNDSS